MRIVLNPKYQHLQAYLEHIDEHFEREGRELHRGRNVLRILKVEGLTLVVKRYGTMPLTHRLATRIYKSNKAKKAYFSPFLLRERGFESPDPVAFVTYRRSWLSSTYYFVCLYSDYRYTMRDLVSLDPEFREEVTRSFAAYTAKLHKNGFLHRDFSADNILFDRVGDRIHFTLIDTNSMKCGRAVSIEKGCQNFARLEGSEEFFNHLGQLYAQARNADALRCIALINEARTQYNTRKPEQE
ncbi:tyrosine protein kinase [Alloprevotella sp. OH1205_COT-284]|uniref:lipopolysaccharide kinase InaA family protein n=1 Tax=Alloprevotella sp. OH1205_COT-284 TaxID=2491043 RepID=UPI000F5DC6B2|nr:lipopolysaccharide kinase InaA family protein [Alloprevotella sp. OH1205_COT-284]RRD80050.1 tyrosine protein kinase [Alloprevotella sp. OH1205_COT-284]